MKKELWIQIFTYKPNSDAAANRAFAFAKFFNNNGYKVHVITNGKSNEIENDNGVIIHRVQNKFRYLKKNIINRFLDNLVFLRGCKKIIRKNKEQIKNSFYLASSPELIPSKAGIYAKKNGAKLIFDVRDIWPEVGIQMGAYGENSIFAKHFRRCANKMYEKCDILTTVGSKKHQYLSKYKNGKYRHKTFLISNGVDLDDLDGLFDYSIIQKFNSYSKKIVSYVGNVGAAQGLDALIEISTEYPDLLFLICGKGKELEKLQKNVIDKSITNVVFTGEINKSQALAVTNSSYISFISLSSNKMVDSVPTKLFESLGLGVPTFLVACGESADILDETGLGVHTSPGHIPAIKDSFKTMITTYDKIINNKNKSIKLIRDKYSRQAACNALLELLEDI
ncbi:MAG: glycosyltransferase family 4 protein [Bacilli bacterium]|jgi:glycosyltransferase involved in cell wall biosynthesis|nr:glycosyltransferase family 4 protein [Bacilli bacterium]